MDSGTASERRDDVKNGWSSGSTSSSPFGCILRGVCLYFCHSWRSDKWPCVQQWHANGTPRARVSAPELEDSLLWEEASDSPTRHSLPTSKREELDSSLLGLAVLRALPSTRLKRKFLNRRGGGGVGEDYHQTMSCVLRIAHVLGGRILN